MRASAETELPRKAQATGPCRVMRTTICSTKPKPLWSDLLNSPSPVPPIPPTTLLTARGSSLTSTCDYAASPRGLLRRPEWAPGALDVAHLPGRVSPHAHPPLICGLTTLGSRASRFSSTTDTSPSKRCPR